MIELAIMIEGQNGLNGPRRQKVARAVEALGFAGLYRSDHYTDANPPDMNSAAFKSLNSRLDEMLSGAARAPGSVKRSLMTGLRFGKDDAALRDKLAGRTAEELRGRGLVAGAPSEVVDHLGQYAEAGVRRIILQWLDLDDLDGLEALAQGVLRQV